MARQPWVRRHLEGLDPEFLGVIEKAAAEIGWLRQASANDLFETAREALMLTRLENPFAGMSAVELGDTPHGVLIERLAPMFESGTGTAADLADQIQLQRAFSEPRAVTDAIASRVAAAISRFPASAEDLKVGHNPGDVLDPYLLAANYELLSERSMQKTIETTASHKVLMKIEDLVGNLHQNVAGFMRGNFRIPEPQPIAAGGKEGLDPARNPFPGADVGQTPIPERPDSLRLFQVKSKTGSAKGGDGKRLGEQLRLLHDAYAADTFFVAIVGHTLKGHRSKSAVLRESPTTVVLVGDAALSELTQSAVGGELLLRVYQRAFRRAARETGYSFSEVVAGIAAVFEQEAEGEDFLQAWLHRAIGGFSKDQDSRVGVAGRGG